MWFGEASMDREGDVLKNALTMRYQSTVRSFPKHKQPCAKACRRSSGVSRMDEEDRCFGDPNPNIEYPVVKWTHKYQSHLPITSSWADESQLKTWPGMPHSLALGGSSTSTFCLAFSFSSLHHFFLFSCPAMNTSNHLFSYGGSLLPGCPAAGSPASFLTVSK